MEPYKRSALQHPLPSLSKQHPNLFKYPQVSKDIISHIISFLPLRDLAQNASISTSWEKASKLRLSSAIKIHAFGILNKHKVDPEEYGRDYYPHHIDICPPFLIDFKKFIENLWKGRLYQEAITVANISQSFRLKCNAKMVYGESLIAINPNEALKIALALPNPTDKMPHRDFLLHNIAFYISVINGNHKKAFDIIHLMSEPKRSYLLFELLFICMDAKDMYLAHLIVDNLYFRKKAGKRILEAHEAQLASLPTLNTKKFTHKLLNCSDHYFLKGSQMISNIFVRMTPNSKNHSIFWHNRSRLCSIVHADHISAYKYALKIRDDDRATAVLARLYHYNRDWYELWHDYFVNPTIIATRIPNSFVKVCIDFGKVVEEKSDN